MLKSFFISTVFLALVAHVLLPMPSQTAAAIPSQAAPPPGTFTHNTYSAALDLNIARSHYQPPSDLPAPYDMHDTAWDMPRQWHGLGPKIGVPRPTLILLHGSGRTGASMIDMWATTAMQNNLILIAPNSATSESWSHQTDGPDFIKALLKDASATYPIDPDKIFIMGHSAGGIFAQQLANRQTGPWKAVATHGAHMDHADVRAAQNPVPIYAYLGAQDHLFPVPQALETTRQLATAGHDVQLIEIPRHTHWYYKIGPQIAPHIWDQLKSHL